MRVTGCGPTGFVVWTVPGRDFYHCGVDRLDSWLNTQRGWRRDDGTAMYRHWHRAFGAANTIAAVVFPVLVLAETVSVRRMSCRAAAVAQG
jgi:hypothetical protein